MGHPGLHAASKEVSDFSSAEAVFGQQLVLPGELTAGPEASSMAFRDDLASSDPPPSTLLRTYADVTSQPPNRELKAARLVYVKRGGSWATLGPSLCGAIQSGKARPKVFRDRDWRPPKDRAG